MLDEEGVWSKFGVGPGSIPDYLGLVGDSADGIPGVPRVGSQGELHTPGQVLPPRGHTLGPVALGRSTGQRSGASGGEPVRTHGNEASLYKRLATLRRDVPLMEDLGDLRWKGVPRGTFLEWCKRLGQERLADAPARWLDED